MKTLSLLFAYLFTIPLLLTHLTASAQRTGKDYALFFVVMDFDHWAGLPGIDKDLREISTELENNYGFQKPDFYLNPRKTDILKVLTDYQSRSFGPDDQLLVFFSMHGYYDEAIGALIPKDGLLDDPGYQTWLLHPALEAMLTKIKCQHILLSLDACYSGTFGQKYKDRPTLPAWESESNDCAAKCKRALEHKSRLYLTSGGKERTPTNSQFARKWLEALRLRNEDGLLSFPKLYSVLVEAFPQPMYGDFKDNAVGGDFVLVRKNACNTDKIQKSVPNAEEQLWKTAIARDDLQIYLDVYPNGKYAIEAINNSQFKLNCEFNQKFKLDNYSPKLRPLAIKSDGNKLLEKAKKIDTLYLKNYLKKIKLNSKEEAECNFSLGYALFINKDFNQSQYYFRKVANNITSEYNNEAYYYLGCISFLYGKLYESQKYFEKVESQSPYYKTSKQYMPLCLYGQGKMNLVVENGDSILGLSSIGNREEVLKIIGFAYYELGDFQKAEKYLKQLQVEYPNLALESVLRLGIIEIELGKYSQAVELLDTGGLITKELQIIFYLDAKALYLTGDKYGCRTALGKVKDFRFNQAIEDESTLNYGKLSYELKYHRDAEASLKTLFNHPIYGKESKWWYQFLNE